MSIRVLHLSFHLYAKSFRHILVRRQNCVTTAATCRDSAEAFVSIQRVLDLRAGRQRQQLGPGAMRIGERFSERRDVLAQDRIPAIIARLSKLSRPLAVRFCCARGS